MNETSKTVAFVISACLLGVAAGATHWMTQPKPVAGFEKVGQEFFPDFEDSLAAQALEVMVYDEETDGLREFSVENKDGLWRIPSHHDYPAEAADRLARTATSVIGLTRESLVARRVRMSTASLRAILSSHARKLPRSARSSHWDRLRETDISTSCTRFSASAACSPRFSATR